MPSTRFAGQRLPRLSTIALTLTLAACSQDGARVLGPTDPAVRAPRPGSLAADAAVTGEIQINSPEGPITLDLNSGVMTTPDGGRVAIEPEELPLLAEQFQSINELRTRLADIAAQQPPDDTPPDCYGDHTRPGCFVNDQRAPVSITPLDDLRPEQDGANLASPRAASTASTLLAQHRPFKPQGSPSALLLYRPAAARTNPEWDGAASFGTAEFTCTDVYQAVQQHAPAYETTAVTMAAANLVVGREALEAARAAGQDMSTTPISQLPKFKALIARLSRFGTWGGAIGAGSYEVLAATYKISATKMAVLVSYFNSMGCGNRMNWPPPNSGSGPGGSGGGSGGSGIGKVTVMCVYTDHYHGDGTFWYTERGDCWMQMT